MLSIEEIDSATHTVLGPPPEGDDHPNPETREGAEERFNMVFRQLVADELLEPYECTECGFNVEGFEPTLYYDTLSAMLDYVFEADTDNRRFSRLWRELEEAFYDLTEHKASKTVGKCELTCNSKRFAESSPVCKTCFRPSCRFTVRGCSNRTHTHILGDCGEKCWWLNLVT